MRIKIFTALISLLAVVFLPALTLAFNPLDNACSGSGANSPVCQQNDTQNSSNTNPVLEKIHVAADIIALVAGVGAIIIIIYSGLRITTMGGSKDNTTKLKEARGSIIGALLGLVVIALAWTIINFVIDKVIK